MTLRKTPLLLSLLLIILTANISHAYAKVHIGNLIGRYLPEIKLFMEPGAFEKMLILPGNSEQIDGILTLKFKEKDNYFGFSALICNKKNAELYAAKKKASCNRTEIDGPQDIVKFNFKGSEEYYLFVVNRTKPLTVQRDIAINAYALTSLNKKTRDNIEKNLHDLNMQLGLFFKHEPWNYAIIPCAAKYVPSSFDKKTLTVCSELVLSDGIVPDFGLMKTAIFYEITPYFKQEWDVKEIKIEQDRIEFGLMLMFLFSEKIDPLKKYIELLEKNRELQNIYITQNAKDAITWEERVNLLYEISSDTFTMMDEWLTIAYDHLNPDVLEQIKEGKYRHYGYLRNAARLVLKRLVEEEAEKNRVPEEEEKNIISDYW
jgi:hypothetical protein